MTFYSMTRVLLTVFVLTGCSHGSKDVVVPYTIKGLDQEINWDQPELVVSFSTDSHGNIERPEDVEGALVEFSRMFSPALEDAMRRAYLRGEEGPSSFIHAVPVELPKNMTEPLQYWMNLQTLIQKAWRLSEPSELTSEFRSRGLSDEKAILRVLMFMYGARLNAEKMNFDKLIEQQVRKGLPYRRPTDMAVSGCDNELVYRQPISVLSNAESLFKASIVHVAICKPSRTIWFYEYDLGWYQADEKRMKALEVDPEVFLDSAVWGE